MDGRKDLADGQKISLENFPSNRRRMDVNERAIVTFDRHDEIEFLVDFHGVLLLLKSSVPEGTVDVVNTGHRDREFRIRTGKTQFIDRLNGHIGELERSKTDTDIGADGNIA